MPPQQAPAYAASPLGSFPELSQMYATSFSSPLSDAKVGVQSVQDKTSIDNANAAAKAAQDAQAAFADKNKYTRVERPDGGFGFYGPDGKEVTAAQYAQNTNQKLTDVLKDSQNPIDIRYIQDQKNVSDYFKAKSLSQSDKSQAAIAQQIEADVKKNHGVDLAKADWRDVLGAMKTAYPTIWGNNQNNAPGYLGTDQQGNNNNIGPNVFLPNYNTAVGQLGGTSKVNKLNSPHGGSNVVSANPTAGY